MRARARTAGLGGAAAVTMVTVLLVGGGTSNASDVPGVHRESGASAEQGATGAGEAGDLKDSKGLKDPDSVQGGRMLYSLQQSGGDGRRQSILARYDRFAPASASLRPEAVTYDRAEVPAGAGIGVIRRATGDGTTVRLEVDGLLKNRTYGAHVHTEPCGARPAQAGPHYQNEKDPTQPSTDPRYANPRNEVWLDFTTDAQGRATAVSHHDWTFREGGARSVVLHDTRTRTEPGHAGEAGDRLACFTVPLAGR